MLIETGDGIVKTLYVEDITQVISGEQKGQYRNFPIQKVVRRSRYLHENTLYFHIYKNRKLNWSQLMHYSNFVIITENAHAFQRLKDQVPIIQVKDIKKAYWQFIGYYRSLFDIPIIGVTGTCGKSTTKEMIKHILSKRLNVVATYRSDNGPETHLGNLMQLDDRTQAAVIELAVINPGDVALGCRYFNPQIRILLNIGVYHLKGCKTPQNYIKAKSEILEGMDPSNDVLLLNGDDDTIKKIDLAACKNILYFGYGDHCQWQARKVKSVKGGITFTLRYENINYKVYVPGIGQHNVYNALAALAAVHQMGFEIGEAIARLQSFTNLERHLEVREGPNGCVILDDNWNNTPMSMESALHALADFAREKRKIAVMGYMYNLGTSKYAKEQYALMGQIVADVGVDILVIIGDKPLEIGKHAIRSGIDVNRVHFVKRGEEVLDVLSPYLSEDTVVLLKAAEDRECIQL